MMGIASLCPVYDKLVDVAFDMCPGIGVTILRQGAALAASLPARGLEMAVFAAA